MRSFVLAVILTSAACSGAEGPLMLAGQDCMQCHSGSAANALSAPTWSVAGTLYTAPDADPNAGVEGGLVHVTDATGVQLTLRSNLAGNFYSADTLIFPLEVCVERAGATRCMQNVVQGSCNGCHTVPSQNHAPGRITTP